MPQGRLQSPLARSRRPQATVPGGTRRRHELAAPQPASDDEIAARAERTLERWRSDTSGRGWSAFERLLGDMAHLPLVESYDVERSYRYVHRDAEGLEPSPAQLRSLEQAARGLSAKEAATELGLSVHTIKSERAGARVVLGARSTTEAVASAIRRGLI